MSSANAASDVSKSPLDYVLESEEVEVDVECTEYGKQKGGAPDISIDEITILVILFHGTVRITEIPRGGYTGVPIDVSKLSSIENLAYLALAPTGLSNIGTNDELTAYKEFTQCQTQRIIESKIFESGIFQDSIKTSLQKIEKKADELVTENASQPVSQPVTENASQPVSQPVKKRKDEVQQAIGIFSKICTYCFHFLKKSESLLLQLRHLLPNYKFTNNFTVCKSVRAASLSGGNGINLLKGGTKRGRIPIPIPPLSMSYDMFVLMLNELRLKIKDFDSKRIPKLCAQQLSCIDTIKEPKLHGYRETLKQTLGNMEERCRSLHILKGFGTTKLPSFINKDLSYNSSPTEDGKSTVDADKNMGVIKLQFRIDSSGKVECNDKPYDPLVVMKAITPYEPKDYDGVYWSNMEACIQHCTEDDHPRSKTTFVIDLTCSSVLGGSDAVIKQPEPGNGDITYTGGGKRIKKKSGSRKKTRRVKNKSRTTRYIRNRRNRLKNNKRTKKSRKTKTSRKH